MYLKVDLEYRRYKSYMSSNIGADRPGFAGGRKGTASLYICRSFIYADNDYARGPHHYICR